ncbi:hypothetical protein [Falsiroseomonas sp. CW058]|uniref:hypothetical protein n=1 Tax=Falsiroseomonas sp. CW058 TaxID=3388664 RepID=UPI003D31DF44
MKTIDIRERGPMRLFTFTDGEHTPANKLAGAVQATGILEASYHDRAGWLSIHADEIVPHGKGERTNRVWITLQEQHARAFYDFLHACYGTKQDAGGDAL